MEAGAPHNGLEAALPRRASTAAAREYFDNIKRQVMAQLGRGAGAGGRGGVRGGRGRPDVSQLKEYAEYLGLQPKHVKYKCHRCTSVSFRSLAMLKKHQHACRATSGDAVGEGVTRKFYMCSACSTYYENWNLFLHMREIHSRHVCLFCLGMFSKAEKLASHLVSKHGVTESEYATKEEFLVTNEGQLYLMCCYCDKLYTEHDHFALHACNGPILASASRKGSKDVTGDKLTQQETNGPKPENDPDDVNQLLEPQCDIVTTDESRTHVPAKNSSEMSQNSENSYDLSQESMDTSNVKVGSPDHKTDNDSSKTESAAGSDLNDSEKSDTKSRTPSIDEKETLAPMDVDPPKNENNNVTSEKDGGIKIKLSLNKSQSPVIINSTVQPEFGPPKPLTRPCRPPGGVPVLSGGPINNMHSTIYDNKPEQLNAMNKVPKLTVRVPKGLLDKDSSSEYSSDSDNSDKLTVDDLACKDNVEKVPTPPPEDPPAELEPLIDPVGLDETTSINKPTENMSAAPVIPPMELTLDKPLDKYPLKELLKVFVAATMYTCVYCNHVRKIAVNCKQLSLHMLDAHRFSATVDSITAEELMPEKINLRVKSGLEEVESIFVNLDTYDNVDPCKVLPYIRTYECFHCYFTTTVHKELYFHNRKMHQKTILLCGMCKSNFYSYSELLCHLCPGTYTPDYEMRFRCCMCEMDNMPSSFRLMVHMRKLHHACDVCTEDCHNQFKLSIHVAKHKLHHLCYRCGIAYRNKQDITKHLFWKHGTESVLCKRCLQKKWPHVYHFCIPPTTFVCEECNLNFTRPVCLRVHKRLHAGVYPHACIEEGCEQKFVSKKLLQKHVAVHIEPKKEEITPKEENRDSLLELKDEKPTVVDGKEVKITENNEVTNSEPKSLLLTKVKRKKNKDKDSFLMDVNLPALNLSESDSSDESDAGSTLVVKKESTNTPEIENVEVKKEGEVPETSSKIIEKKDDEKPILEINEKVTPPKVAIMQPEVAVVPSDVKAAPTEVNATPSEVNVTPSEISEVNVTLSEVNVTPPEVKIIRSEVKATPSEVKIIASEVNVTQSEVNVTQSEVKVSPSEVKVPPSEMKVTPYEVKSTPSEVKVTPEVKVVRQKTPPLVPIRKHVCESDHDYCIIPNDYNGDEYESPDKNKRSPKKKAHKNSTGSSSSSSSSSSSDSDSSRGSGSSSSSSSGSSSSSSSDSDSSDSEEEKKKKALKKDVHKLTDSVRSNAAPLDVMATEEPPVKVPEKREPPIDESDLDTDESDTDEEFYDKYPQRLANKLYSEKRNQLMLLASVAPSDNGSIIADMSRPGSPLRERHVSKKKSKNKKRKKSKREDSHRIKLNIPKELINMGEHKVHSPAPGSNKIRISLHSNKVQSDVISRYSRDIPRNATGHMMTIDDSKRASKRRRIPNRFYGYSSDEEPPTSAFKPTQPPKLEWRKEDLPSPSGPPKSLPTVSHKPSPTVSHRSQGYSEPMIRMSTPIIDPVPPPNLMNTESNESSGSDSSDEGTLKIDQPIVESNPIPVPVPSTNIAALPPAQQNVYFPKPAGAREAREGESVYCYCRCPYDEVSEMIACDADGCSIEWFHFECVGIMVPPKGKWYCPDCRARKGLY